MNRPESITSQTACLMSGSSSSYCPRMSINGTDTGAESNGGPAAFGAVARSQTAATIATATT